MFLINDELLHIIFITRLVERINNIDYVIFRWTSDTRYFGGFALDEKTRVESARFNVDQIEEDIELHVRDTLVCLGK